MVVHEGFSHRGGQVASSQLLGIALPAAAVGSEAADGAPS